MITTLKVITCAAITIVNTSGLEWNDHDDKILEHSKKVCATNPKYSDTPCLKKFIKKEKRHYNAICGKEK